MGFSQKLITYKAENQPLNVVLSRISNQANVRFAFDDDFLSKIPVSINVRNITAEDFLKQLCAKYPVAYRLIGTTWVIYKDEKIAIVRSKPNVTKQNETSEIKPVKTNNEYIIKRLWDLEGTVTDAKSGTRLRYAQLYFDEFTQPKTNNAGFFSDEIVGAGDVRATIYHRGYYPLDTLFKAADSQYITLKLNPITIAGINDEDQFAEFPLLFHNQSKVISINGNSGVFYGGKEVTDFTNSFRFLSGIGLNETHNMGITIRNGSYSTMNILLDEIPIMNQTHLFGQVSAINADFIHQGYLSRGGLEAWHNTNSSGLIDLVGRNGFGKPTVNLTASLLNASLFLGLPLSDKLSFSAAVRKSTVDYWPNFYYQRLSTAEITIQNESLNPATEQAVELYNNYLDLNTKLTLQPNARNEVNIVFNYGTDEQKRDFQLSLDNEYFLHTGSTWDSYSLGITWKQISPANWNNLFVASASRLNSSEWNTSGTTDLKGLNDYQTSNNSDSTNLNQFQIKWKSEKSFKIFTHSFGAEFNYFNCSYNYANSILESSEASISSTHAIGLATPFYQLKYRPLKWVELSTGVRGSVNLGLNTFIPQPRLSLDIQPNKQLELFYRFGQEVLPLYKTQRFNAQYQSASLWILANEAKNVMKTWQHIAGGVYENNGLLINLEAYRIMDIGKSAYFQVSSNEPQNINITNLLIEGSGIRQGIDFMLHYQHQIFHHSLTYSVADVKDTFTPVLGDINFKGLNMPRHQLRFTEMVRHSGWIATARFNYISERSYLIPASTNTTLEFSQLQGFVNFDLSIIKQFRLGNARLETGVVLLNILNTETDRDLHFYNLWTPKKNVLVSTTSQSVAFTPSFFIKIIMN